MSNVYNFKQFVKNESSNNIVDKLKNDLREIEDWFPKHSYGKPEHNLWEEKAEEANAIRKELFKLTGSPYGETEEDRSKKNIEPSGIYDTYNNPYDVPIDVYKWIFKRTSLLNTDAIDSVRWSRIINSKDDERLNGEITIFRAVDDPSYTHIREGDWVTTDEKYATEHNNRYFDGKGVVISEDVNGEDVLASPTGNYEEAIYAPLKYSIDVEF